MTLYQIPVNHVDWLKNMAARGVAVLPYMVKETLPNAVKRYWPLVIFNLPIFTISSQGVVNSKPISANSVSVFHQWASSLC